MSSFHRVCLIAKGKVEDCRALCEELEAEGYEEGYELKGEDDAALDFENADSNLLCEFSFCQARDYPLEVGDFSSEKMDVRVLNFPLEPDGSMPTYIHLADKEVKEFCVIIDEESYMNLEQEAKESGEDWAPGYGEGEEWIRAEKKIYEQLEPGSEVAVMYERCAAAPCDF